MLFLTFFALFPPYLISFVPHLPYFELELYEAKMSNFRSLEFTLLSIKAMHLTKNFTIPSFAKIDIIGIPTGKNLTKISRLISAFDFRKTYRKSYRNSGIFSTFLTFNGICQKYTGIFKN